MLGRIAAERVQVGDQVTELAIGVDQVEDAELTLGLRRRCRTPIGAILETGEKVRPVGADRLRGTQVLPVEILHVVGVRPQDEIEIHDTASPYRSSVLT